MTGPDTTPAASITGSGPSRISRPCAASANAKAVSVKQSGQSPCSSTTSFVYLSADDILYDGNHRLKIWLELGHKTITEDEIIRNPKLRGRRNAYSEAVKLQRNRRQLTGEAMAKVIWHYALEYGMSQTMIGKEIGMRQQSVSELMRKYDPPQGAPETITSLGEDGKEYTRTTKTPTTKTPTTELSDPPAPKPRPWERDGEAVLVIRRARRVLADKVPSDGAGNPLDRFQRMELRDLLRALAKDCNNFVDTYLPEQQQ